MDKRRSAATIFQEQQNQQIQRQRNIDPQEEPFAQLAASAPQGPPPPPLGSGFKTSEELQLEKEPIRVRETGYAFWKRVIVPPNAYVVHTRIKREQPVTIGLGVSFRYNPYTDAYLVVPAAMQTIGVVANCISKEKQGINILAYVQWQIDDFAIAYRKLDFSDSRDPLSIVNAQLREQAEAGIKDKIATMSVEEVLTDKAPIIEELTTRLKAVTEGRGQGNNADEGLGIKIVTVQIREALVSSERLWDHLQAPFRHEQEKLARVSHLAMQDQIKQKELETHQQAETREAETMVAIERIKQSKQTEASEIRLNEEATRFTREQETARQKIQLEETTTVARRESEQRLHTQSAQIEQEKQLRALQLIHDKTLAEAQLQTEAEKQQQSMQTEQALHEIAENNRLEELRVQAAQLHLEQEKALKTQEAALQLLLQEQEIAAKAQALQADLAQQQQTHAAQLLMEEESLRVKLAAQEKELEIERLRQEIRNLVNERDLLRHFISQLPELAAHMPEIHELRVLQTGSGDAAFDNMAAFVTKAMALAQSMGLKIDNQAS
ncbi:MAG: hypothetical protein R3E31_14715 [Chloroflexota bacterium]|nr:hypothetical protein [Ardenticatenaceae bacterium]